MAFLPSISIEIRPLTHRLRGDVQQSDYNNPQKSGKLKKYQRVILEKEARYKRSHSV